MIHGTHFESNWIIRNEKRQWKKCITNWLTETNHTKSTCYNTCHMHHFNYVAHKASSNTHLAIGKGNNLSAIEWEQTHQSWIVVLKMKLDFGPSNWLTWPHANHLMVNWMTNGNKTMMIMKMTEKIQTEHSISVCYTNEIGYFSPHFSQKQEKKIAKSPEISVIFGIVSNNFPPYFYLCVWSSVCFSSENSRKINKSCRNVVLNFTMFHLCGSDSSQNFVMNREYEIDSIFQVNAPNRSHMNGAQFTVLCAYVCLCETEQYVWHSACGLIITSSHSIFVHTIWCTFRVE